MLEQALPNPTLAPNQNGFYHYKRAFVFSARRILAEGTSDALNEAALPAYANSNPLSSYLFWRRVQAVMNCLGSRLRYKAAMDFGCGSGVMLPYLSRVAERVVAVDIDLTPLNKMASYLQFPLGVQQFDMRQTNLDDFEPASFDWILALDV